MAKKIDLTTYSKDELNKLVATKQEDLRSLRFNVAGSKTRNVKAARTMRKEIARALTALATHK